MALLLGGTAAAVVGLALLDAGRPAATATPEAGAAPTPLPSVPAPTPFSTRPPALSSPSSTETVPPTSTAAANQPVDAPAPEPTPPRYARVFNTNGLGVNLRKEPGPQGQPLLAVAEATVLRVLGPEETVQARVWRLCEHEARGVQGWVPAEYLQPSDQGPTPGRP